MMKSGGRRFTASFSLKLRPCPHHVYDPALQSGLKLNGTNIYSPTDYEYSTGGSNFDEFFREALVTKVREELEERFAELEDNIKTGFGSIIRHSFNRIIEQHCPEASNRAESIITPQQPDIPPIPIDHQVLGCDSPPFTMGLSDRFFEGLDTGFNNLDTTNDLDSYIQFSQIDFPCSIDTSHVVSSVPGDYSDSAYASGSPDSPASYKGEL